MPRALRVPCEAAETNVYSSLSPGITVGCVFSSPCIPYQSL
jgi:hypothetical protein